MKIFAFAASLRSGSRNRQLLDLAVERLEAMNVTVDLADFSEFDVPLYNQDIQDASGIADGALHLADRLDGADAFIIASPEYNHSMPGTLKNLLDWVSRIRPEQPFGGTTGMLMSASPSMVGGSRGLYHLRQPFTALGVRMYSDMFSLAQAHKAYDDEGKIESEGLSDFLTSVLEGYVDFVERLSEKG